MDAETRVALWQAFSTFFLDTEPDATTFRHVARVVREAGVSIEQAESVLWNEVFPVLYRNLQSVAGVWDGWSREWLIDNICPSDGPVRRSAPRSIIREIQRCWAQTLAHLDPHS